MLTTFKDGRVLWPSIGYDGRSIVFERDFQIWTYGIATKQAAPVAIQLRGAAAGSAVDHVKLTSQFRELSVSPDGKKVAFTAHGEIFAVSAKDGGDAIRVSNSPAVESQPAWAPNSRSLIYVSTRHGMGSLFEYNFSTRDETRLTDSPLDDSSPVVSPDGQSIAFMRNGQELRVLDLSNKKDRVCIRVIWVVRHLRAMAPSPGRPMENGSLLWHMALKRSATYGWYPLPGAIAVPSVFWPILLVVT
jgi:Tol biopolymer transport system component